MLMWRKTKTSLFFVMALAIALPPQFFANIHSVSAASPGDIVINELMYNPVSDNQDDEYLELYNTTASPIDLEGWCFTDGITLVTTNPGDPSCFESGTTIAANGYLIISPNATQTNTTYSLTPSAVYTGTNLSNGGETITLVDNTATEIDTVDYLDENPWPASPDGDGPSLELKDPSLDNTNPDNWGASVGGATPMAENSWLSLDLPTIANVTDPNDITASDTVTIKANLTDANSAELIYRVMFNAEQSLTMYDDGTHGDVTSGDDSYSAQIPVQTAGQLVRFRVEATNADGTIASPSTSDSINYHGYVVNDPSQTSQLEIFNWFIEDSVYTDLMTNHVEDEEYVSCVIEIDGKVYDNSVVRIKGEYSKNFPKKSLKFKLPPGYEVQVSGKMGHAIDEFHMNSEWLDETKAMTETAWWAAEQIGLEVPEHFGTRVLRNNQYEGYYLLIEKFGNDYMNAHNKTGNLYEETLEVVEPESADPNAATNWRDSLWLSRSAARTETFYNTTDTPSIVNFMAFQSLINGHDWNTHSNTHQYYDTETRRWSFWLWDLDIIMGFRPAVITPYVTPSYFSAIPDRIPFTNLYDEPEGKQMFFRRLRTLADKFYGDDNLLQTKYLEYVDKASTESNLDLQKWGSSNGENGLYTTSQQDYVNFFVKLKRNFFARYRNDRAIPLAQSSGATVEINQVSIGLAPDSSYIELINNSSIAIDMSTWQIDELNYTLPAGSVIASGDRAYIPRSDITFKTTNSGSYVIGQLPQDLLSNGTLTLERSDGSISDIYNY